jgi:hypothetical protein
MTEQLAEVMTNNLLNQELLNTIPENCREQVIAHWVEQVIEFNANHRRQS